MQQSSTRLSKCFDCDDVILFLKFTNCHYGTKKTLNHILLRLDGLQQAIDQCLAKKKYRQVHTQTMLKINNGVWRLVFLSCEIVEITSHCFLLSLLSAATILVLMATVNKANQPPIHLILQVKVTTHLLPITNITSNNDAHFMLCKYTIVFFFPLFVAQLGQAPTCYRTHLTPGMDDIDYYSYLLASNMCSVTFSWCARKHS